MLHNRLELGLGRHLTFRAKKNVSKIIQPKLYIYASYWKGCTNLNSINIYCPLIMN